MSGTWSWYVGPLRYDDKCSQCAAPLRGKSGEVVLWCDGQKYHTACVLDKLAVDYQVPFEWTGVCPRI